MIHPMYEVIPRNQHEFFRGFYATLLYYIRNTSVLHPPQSVLHPSECHTAGNQGSR
jgi:hypothetical protein